MTQINFKEVGKRIKAKREEERISAPDLALKLRTNYQNVYKWEKGAKPSDPEEYKRLMQWLEFGINDTMVHESDPEYSTNGNLSATTLLNLSESNRVLAESNKTLAEANKQLADNTVILTSAYTKSIGGAASNISSDVLATLQALQEYVPEIAAQVKKTSVEKTAAELGTRMVQKKKALDKKGSHAGEGR